MKQGNDIHKLIKKLHIKASAELDRRVNNDISQTLVKLQKIESARAEPNIWRFITKGGVTKLAVAATIIIAFGIGFSIGQRSNPTRLATYSLDVSGYTSAVSAYPTATASEDSFWRQKALAAMQPRPYAQTQITKTSLIDAYKQYLKEKHYD
jgi:hypothetical protein